MHAHKYTIPLTSPKLAGCYTPPYCSIAMIEALQKQMANKGKWEVKIECHLSL